MSFSGGPQLTFRPLTADDVEAISGIHHRACVIAYAFINWRYPLDEVERWYSGKFAEWSWTQAAFEADVMAGFIALSDRHIDQLYVDPSQQRRGIGCLLLEQAIEKVPGRLSLDLFEENLGACAFYEEHGFVERDRWMNTEEGAIDLLYVRG
jgi:GNAT superfamily N-acetyltransferase